ncbi:23S rRNA pseudouridine(955/2504/2580) synthase RluC [soil metagenome]
MINLTKQNASIVVIEEEQVGQRIDNYLQTKLKGVPKSHVYRIIRKGEVRVNKGRIQASYRLCLNDNVRIPPLQLKPAAPIKSPPAQQTRNLAERILYEDKNLLIVNKPSGMAVHGGSGISFGVIETFRSMYPQWRYLELVHRLDRDTSGCLMLAKKPSILKEIHELLRVGNINKTYIALVNGIWPEDLTEVDVALQKSQLSSGERMVKVTEEGKASVTRFRLLEEFSNTSLIQASPKTGRTHQIRVHTAYKNHPIAGDDKYGNKDFNRNMRELGCKRLFLHAVELSFKLVSQDQVIKIRAELDEDLEATLAGLRT